MPSHAISCHFHAILCQYPRVYNPALSHVSAQFLSPPSPPSLPLQIMGVSSEYVASRDPLAPFVVFGLLRHENKMSVVNYAIKLHPSHPEDEPIKSKDRLVFFSGVRKFSAQPVFSQHTTGSKQKFERFLVPGDVCVATLIAPITFPPGPVLVFRCVGPAGGNMQMRLIGRAAASIRTTTHASLHSSSPTHSLIPRNIHQRVARNCISKQLSLLPSPLPCILPLHLWQSLGIAPV